MASTWAASGHDDERRDHPEHPVRAFHVRQDVAVERPHAEGVGLDEDVVALAGVDPSVSQSNSALPSG